MGPQPLGLTSNHVACGLARPLRIAVITSDVTHADGPLEIGQAMTTLADTLAADGHDVTLAAIEEPFAPPDPSESWLKQRKGRPARSLMVPASDVPIDEPWHKARSYEAYRWLKQQSFDVIHFAESCGHAYYSVVAKHQGLAFEESTLIVNVQGPRIWQRLGRFEYVDRIDDLEVSFMERQSIALGDVAIVPNQHLLNWMKSWSWELPARCHVQPNLFRDPEKPAATPTVHPINELVFLGRLDAAKGLGIFCEALDRIAKHGPDVRITFLGPVGSILGRAADDFIHERALNWPFPWEIIPRFDLNYLHAESRLAVIPFLMEGSSRCVQECLAAGVPFVASDVGGTAELIHADDRSDVLFQPHPKRLAERLFRCLEEGGSTARPAIVARANRQAWLEWHRHLPPVERRSLGESQPLVSVCIPHHDRPTLLQQALESIERQTYPNIEVVVVDDGSASVEAKEFLSRLEPRFAERNWQLIRQENRYPGAARNKAARQARGKYVLFMDDDNYATPGEISTLVRVAERTGADFLTSVINVFKGAKPPGNRPLKHWLPLGSALAAGVLNNCFGDMNALVRRDTFLALGGMTEDYGLSHEDWELFAKATLHGYKLEVVPEPLFWYRVTEGSITHSTLQAANYLRHLRPYLETVPESLRELLIYCHGMKFRTDALSKEHGNMYTYAKDLERYAAETKRWSNHVEREYQALAKVRDTLIEQSEEMRAWSKHVEEEYHRLKEVHEELCGRFAWRRYELADRVVRWIKKVPLAFPALHRVARRMASRGVG